MEELTIPILSILGAISAVAVHLLLRTQRNETRIAVGDSNISNLSKQLEEVKEDMEKRIDKFEGHVNAKFDRVFDEIRMITRR